MKQQKMNINKESGRSMVEMLGVLAVIGVLSIGGIAGYTYGMNKYRSNEVLNSVSQMAIVASQQRTLNPDKAINLSEFRNKTVYPFTTDIADLADTQFAIKFTGIPKQTCDRLLADSMEYMTATDIDVNGTQIDESSVACGDTNDFIYYFDNSLNETTGSSTEPADPCAGVTCDWGGICTDGTCTCNSGKCDTDCQTLGNQGEGYCYADCVAYYGEKRCAGVNSSGCVCTCYTADTPIMLADGTCKRAADITYDDELLVWNFDEGRFDSAKPLWLQVPLRADSYNYLRFSDGSVLKTINQHRIFNREKGKFTYPMTDDTPIGTTTLNAKGEWVTLEEKAVIHEQVIYYNIITDYHINCFAGGVLTSNRFNNIYPIKDLKFVKDNRTLVPYSEYTDVPRRWYDGLRLAEQPREINHAGDVRFDSSVSGYIHRCIRNEQIPVYQVA